MNLNQIRSLDCVDPQVNELGRSQREREAIREAVDILLGRGPLTQEEKFEEGNHQFPDGSALEFGEMHCVKLSDGSWSVEEYFKWCKAIAGLRWLPENKLDPDPIRRIAHFDLVCERDPEPAPYRVDEHIPF